MLGVTSNRFRHLSATSRPRHTSRRRSAARASGTGAWCEMIERIQKQQQEIGSLVWAGKLNRRTEKRRKTCN